MCPCHYTNIFQLSSENSCRWWCVKLCKMNTLGCLYFRFIIIIISLSLCVCVFGSHVGFFFLFLSLPQNHEKIMSSRISFKVVDFPIFFHRSLSLPWQSRNEKDCGSSILINQTLKRFSKRQTENMAKTLADLCHLCVCVGFFFCRLSLTNAVMRQSESIVH